MDSREKAVKNKDKAIRHKTIWNVQVEQARYSDDGHWYATLARFPAALFDASGYIFFATETEYRSAPMSIGKQISVPKPGISAIPGYVRMADALGNGNLDATHFGFATESDIEGTKTEVLYIKRHRSRRLRELALQKASGICCVCDNNFSNLLDGRGVRVLQVHHRRQISTRDAPSVTKVSDLAVVCANCHMLLHLNSEAPLQVEELRDMLRTTPR